MMSHNNVNQEVRMSIKHELNMAVEYLKRRLAETKDGLHVNLGTPLQAKGNEYLKRKISHTEKAIELIEKIAITSRTISDCLEFLEERGFYLEGLYQVDECEYELCISEMDDMGMVKHSKRKYEGKNPLEVCTKAVSVILKENKCIA